MSANGYDASAGRPGRADVEAALELVQRDCLAAGGQRSDVLVDDGEWGLRLVGTGDAGAELQGSGAVLLVAVASAVSDSFVEQLWRAWPLCAQHDCALHPRLHEQVPTWWCQAADGIGHPVAAVGVLPASAVKPGTLVVDQRTTRRRALRRRS